MSEQQNNREKIKLPKKEAVTSTQAPQPAPKQKREKEYIVQYRGKQNVGAQLPLDSNGGWKFLSDHYRLDQAQLEVKKKENGHALQRMCEYRIIDKSGKEVSNV